MSEFSSLVQAYYQSPINNRKIENADLSRHEGNTLCGDDITVYMKVFVESCGNELSETPALSKEQNYSIAERSYD